jgi:hypothetical protein
VLSSTLPSSAEKIAHNTKTKASAAGRVVFPAENLSMALTPPQNLEYGF